MASLQTLADRIRVLVADDHELVRFGIVRMLQDAEDIDVVGEAASGRVAVALAGSLRPDVVLMDVRMPGMDGMEATRRVLEAWPEAAVLGVSVHDEEPFPSQLLRAGALGYIIKGASFTEILSAIRTVHGGDRYISPGIAQSMVARDLERDQDEGSPFDRLSYREMQICQMVARCEKVQDISSKLHLSPKTVNTYRYRIFEKLRINSDVELALLALRHGVVELPGS